MEPKDYWAAVRLGWKQICACLIAALVLGGVFAWQQSGSEESSYAATRKLYMAGPAPQPGAEGLIASYVEVAGGTLMTEKAGDKVGYAVEAGTVTVAVATTNVLEITATDASRERADEIVDAYVEVLPGLIQQVDDSPEPVEFTTISSATVEILPVSGGSRILLLATMLGLGSGLAWALSLHGARLGREDRA